MIFTLQKIAFSVDSQQLKNRNLNFSITEPCRDNLKLRFLIKSGYYTVPTPSTALIVSNNLLPMHITSVKIIENAVPKYNRVK